MVSDTIAEIRELLKPVFEQRRDQLMAAYLFGSQANGTAWPTSDVDLAILLKPEAYRAGADLRLEMYADCSRVLKRNDVDIVLLNCTRNLFLLYEITSQGVVIFDDDREARHDFEVRVQHDFFDFRDHRLSVMGV